MNKLYLGGIVVSIAMLGATYATIGYQKGGLNGDIVNKLAVLGAIAIAMITIWVVVKYVRQMQTDTATGELADESWDNIGEYKNPVPMGWAISFIGTMIWGMWYFLFGYPVNAYSQIGEYNQEVKEKSTKFEAKYADLKGDRLVEMGESVFLANCQMCHGINADGMDGKAANLNQRLEEKVVKYVIKNGSNNFKDKYPGGMPAGMASGDDVEKLAKYVAGGLKGEKPAAWATCAGCHGEDGKGQPYVAPNIAEFTPELVTTVLNNGKKGVIGRMPAFNILNAKQKEAVGAYISSLSKGE
jgi:cytochrome c oxidase cbb3-type subunit 3